MKYVTYKEQLSGPTCRMCLNFPQVTSSLRSPKPINPVPVKEFCLLQIPVLAFIFEQSTKPPSQCLGLAAPARLLQVKSLLCLALRYLASQE